MTSVLQQLERWRFLERVVRVVWGAGRWLALGAAVLLLACLTDFLIDRYSGSQTWRNVLTSSRIFAGVSPLSAGETPLWFRILLTLAQCVLAVGLAFVFLIRPWLRTPPVDDLASHAEKVHRDFDHRLVTALQLNRATAQTQGMSKFLIGEVTRQATEIASRYNLLKLINLSRLWWTAAVVAPVVLIWLVFFAMNPALAGILVKRQALMDVEIPRRIHLKNVTRDIWPIGAAVLVRFEVTGEFDPELVGVLRIVPDGEPEEFYQLTYEGKKPNTEDTAFFATKLPPSSRDFSFQARLGDGRTKEAGRVVFEPPPYLSDKDGLFASQQLPDFLGRAPNGGPYFRESESPIRGDLVDALPLSKVIVDGKFNKPVAKAVLVPVERVEGSRERDLPGVAGELGGDRKSATWIFPTTPKLIGYRIELVDDLEFINTSQIRRNIRMWDDRPPVVEFNKESVRNPDPTDEEGKGPPSDYVWDMALSPQGRIMVIYRAQSELGIREANIRYRVIPKGVQLDLYPEWYKNIHHPREDRDLRVFSRLNLLRGPDPIKNKLGEFIPELGLFRYSFRGVSVNDRDRIDYGFYPFPSPDPVSRPGELEAGGRKNFEISELRKMMPDGKYEKLEIGDTVELYVEVFDKLPGPNGKPDLNRVAGYTREAKRKIVMSEKDVELALLQRGEEKQKRADKLRELTNDQISVFREKKK